MSVLDLKGEICPVSLLKCRKALAGMRPGEELEVILDDPRVARDLLDMLGPTADRVGGVRQQGGACRVKIFKGS